MSKAVFTFVALALLASCSSGSKQPARNLNNACSILDQRSGYHRAFKATERKWGVPVHVQMAIIHQESKFDGDAKTPRQYRLGIIPAGRQSSAYGYAQALDGTWGDYKDQEGRWRASRTNIRDASDFMGWYMNKTRKINGIPVWDARNQYLAYHEGHTGYRRGSHYGKEWLMDVADKVQRRANLYQEQLAECS